MLNWLPPNFFVFIMPIYEQFNYLSQKIWEFTGRSSSRTYLNVFSWTHRKKCVYRRRYGRVWWTTLSTDFTAFRIVIKVLNTDRRWRERTCLLICITFRPKNVLIIIYQWPISHEDNIANPWIKNSRYWWKSKSKLMLKN